MCYGSVICPASLIIHHKGMSIRRISVRPLNPLSILKDSFLEFDCQ